MERRKESLLIFVRLMLLEKLYVFTKKFKWFASLKTQKVDPGILGLDLPATLHAHAPTCYSNSQSVLVFHWGSCNMMCSKALWI